MADVTFYADCIRKGDDPEAVLRVALAAQRESILADIEDSRPVRDEDTYRIGMHAGIDRALFRVQNPTNT
jgi:hypothetical protein